MLGPYRPLRPGLVVANAREGRAYRPLGPGSAALASGLALLVGAVSLSSAFQLLQPLSTSDAALVFPFLIGILVAIARSRSIARGRSHLADGRAVALALFIGACLGLLLHLASLALLPALPSPASGLALFWSTGHPEVYAIALPCFAVLAALAPLPWTMLRTSLAASTACLLVLSLLVLAHHFEPSAPFALSAASSATTLAVATATFTKGSLFLAAVLCSPRT